MTEIWNGGGRNRRRGAEMLRLSNRRLVVRRGRGPNGDVIENNNFEEVRHSEVESRECA